MRRLLVLIIAILVAAASGSAVGQNSILADFSISGGYTENLLNDSSDIGDSFSSYTGKVRFYPFPALEVSGRTGYTYYGDQYNLSNFDGGVGVVYIPTRDESPFSLYVAANFDGRRYRQEFQAFDENSFDATVSAGYRVSPTLATRIGIVMRSTAYISSESGDKSSWEAFTGVNFTPYGRNSLDVELGYGTARYNYIRLRSPDPPWDYLIDVPGPESLLRGGGLQSLYLAQRYSRPLGFKTGLNITYMFRTFMNSEDGLVYGASIGLLSPWTSVWEGHSITINLKSFLIPTVMLTTGAGYWEKTFFSTVEGQDVLPYLEDTFIIIVRPVGRADVQRKFYLQLQRPVSTPLGVLQPNVRVDYVDNDSTNDLFDYSGFSISVGLSYQL